MALSSRIEGVFLRSPEAEGNPLHKSFSRIDGGSQRVALLTDGLAASADWHRDRQVKERRGAGAAPNDRALLLQCVEHVERLCELVPEAATTLKHPASFGENVRLRGALRADTLCVGDVLEVRAPSDSIVGLLQVTSPRWPCYKVDKNHPSAGEVTPLFLRAPTLSQGRHDRGPRKSASVASAAVLGWVWGLLLWMLSIAELHRSWFLLPCA
jgi:hypothetical protein